MQNHSTQFLLFFLFFSFLFSSCTHYRASYSKAVKGKPISELPDSSQLAFTLYLTGNTVGDTSARPGFDFFKKQIRQAPENSAALLLGNMTRQGLPHMGTLDRAEAETALSADLEALHPDRFAGQPILLAGQNEWAQSEPLEGMKRLEDFVEDYFNTKEQVLFPEAGCGDPTAIELTEDLALIIIDSRWWMLNWDHIEDFNDGCDVTTRSGFDTYMKDKIGDYKDKNVIIALHHPPLTNGEYGGQFSLASHLFPLRELNENLWIPLPGVGSLVNVLRSSTGKNPDLTHPFYYGLSRKLQEYADTYTNVIFVSAYEKNLQYFEQGRHRYIVSGAAGETSPTRTGKGAQFSAGRPGHAVLKVYDDGSIYTEYYLADGEGQSGKLVFRKRSLSSLAERDRTPPFFEVPQVEYPLAAEDSLQTTTVYTRAMRLKINRFLFGKYNSDLYGKEVKARVLRLDDYQGGMQVLRTGGSTQTVSLRLADTLGRTYNLRSLRKNPFTALPDAVNFPLSQRFMRHFFTGINPFGALVVSRLSDAVDITHAKPKLFYLPQQEILGGLNPQYADQLYLMEERPDDTWLDSGKFGDTQDFISYRKLFEKIRKEDDKLVKVNQHLTLRIRLLDIMIGDFDRHQDQFRFAERETEDAYIYDPVPRDRDVAFSNWDGLLFYFGKLTDPLIRMSHDYDKRITDLKWLIYQSRGFDNNFLNELSWEEWEKEVKYMQAGLSDEVIDQAVRQLPEGIYEIKAEEMKEALTARRNDLMKYARQFYKFINRRVEIVGTDDHDVFEVERQDDGTTIVRGWTASKKGKRKTLFYERTFTPDITKEIRIYSLDKEDFFEVKGEGKKGIRLRLVGGYEDDTFNDSSKVSGLFKKTIIHDTPTGNEVIGGSETADKRNEFYEDNNYEYFKGDKKFNYLIPLANAAYNPDDGFVVGLTADYFSFPYRKRNKQSIALSWAFATKAFNFNYNAKFNRFLRSRWDLLLHAENFGPQFTDNFFGIGNETKQQEVGDLGFNFNRVRLSRIEFSPTLKRPFVGGNYFSVGLLGESVEIEKTPGRILDTDFVDVNPDVFNRNYFGGIKTEFVLNFLKNKLEPENAFKLTTSAAWRADLSDFSRDYLRLGAEMTVYQTWGAPSRFVLASRMGYTRNFGEYYFYQGVNLGGNSNLRGFRFNRFTGDAAFYHNTDLRWRAFVSRNRFIPFSAGLLVGMDYGRVWVENEDSKQWHIGYGGGVWISPLEIVVLNAGWFLSEEERRFSFRLGYAF